MRQIQSTHRIYAKLEFAKAAATHATPMISPPSALHPVPIDVTPPFVPCGTLLPDVIKTGRPSDSIPSSEASVSARLVAWWATRAHASADARGDSPKSDGFAREWEGENGDVRTE